ncbi:MAG TPA: YggS family pyridoxal phosphate-dependent enzyme [Candidatus Aerophobetes bacterium]|uniref:Pyridoxal phosphate homeostasis protein n=1 Tax=Aerophobetes bacterium TaxID=2030807 RepID=A0A7V5LZR2_UNCAE|nr:YggS family pyridoxal phosphate-dependent enzyme [Candidatus Aerophobetes bacterium]
MSIKENVVSLLREIPSGVIVVAAAKGRTPQEIMEAIEGGIEIVGENYVQEAEKAFSVIGRKVKWHFIGHLQKNKVKKAVEIFDLIETVDSVELAREIDKRCSRIGKVMPVFCEINIAKEKSKSGVYPEEVEELVRQISSLKNIKVEGLMTMGPFFEDPEKLRPYFRKTKEIFENIREKRIPRVEMKYLSMGMSSSYKVAIEEGANIVRIGTKIFGPRLQKG